jgi:PAS domain S-box-containing protein
VERERRRLLSVLEQLPHFAYLVAADYGVRFANQKFVELFGEVEGKTCYQLLHGSNVPCARCETLDVLRTGESDVQLWTTPEGRVYRLFDTRLEVPGGEDVVLEVGMDVTESRRVERVLHLTRHSVDSASISIFWITPDGRFTFANETAHRSLGYSAEGMRGKGVWDIDPEYPRDQRAAQWERIRNEGMIVFESTHRRLDGTIIPVEITSQYLEFEGDEYELAFATDISERELAEAERRTLEAELRQVQKLESIGTFASGIAHEINNPLMGMINYAELISTRVKDPRLKEFAEEIKSEGDRVAGIVRNLLFFARQETEHHSPARIADIAAAALSIMGALLRKEGITVEVDVPDDLPEVFCRSQQIQQVLINLLTNARDALNSRYPHSDPNKSIRIVSRVVEDAGVKWVRTTVEDHGIGIPAEIVDRVFDPFFTTKPRDRGTGLGLSISYGIVRDHEGQLWIEGVPGEETRVHMDLPLPEAVS